MNLSERAETAKATILEGAIFSLHSEAGADGIFFPANDTERTFARYWTDEHYTWENMVDDITDEALIDGQALEIMPHGAEKLLDAAVAFGDTIKEQALTAVREELYKADQLSNDGTKQASCDAVTWFEVAGNVLEYLDDEIDAENLQEAEVQELEKLALQVYQ